MTVQLKLSGFKELEAELAKLKSPTRRGVARRSMRKALAPVASAANAFWPGADDQAFVISGKVKRGQPQPQDTPTLLHMMVGSPKPHAQLLEFGTGPRHQKNGRFTGSVSPLPMLQPAWDGQSHTMLRELRTILGEEIQKTFARITARVSD